MDILLPLPARAGSPCGADGSTRPAGFDQHDGPAPPSDAQPLRHGYVLGGFHVLGGGDSGIQTFFFLLGASGRNVALGDDSICIRGHGIGRACDVRWRVASSTRALGVAFSSDTSLSRNCRRIFCLGAIRHFFADRICRSLRGDRRWNREGLVVALGECVETARFSALGLCLHVGRHRRRGMVPWCHTGCADRFSTPVRSFPCGPRDVWVLGHSVHQATSARVLH